MYDSATIDSNHPPFRLVSITTFFDNVRDKLIENEVSKKASDYPFVGVRL